MLNPDPVKHALALLAKGQINEALQFSASVSKNLTQVVKGLTDLRIKIHASIFEKVAKSGTLTEAVSHYQLIESLSEAVLLKDQAVETRYVRALFATQTPPTPISRKHRHMTLVEQLRSVFDLPGEIAECGCYRGLSSWMICATLNEENDGFDGIGFHIFDSFAGLSPPAPEDAVTAATPDRNRLAEMLQPGRFTCSEEDVRRHLAAFPGIAYHPGWLPQSLAGEAERTYRFIHLDVDLYEPTLGALAYFYPRLVPGGVILTDDYGWPGARQAFDQFSAQHDLVVEEMAGNQAVLRRRR
nr:TylF/MycF/NovP-related O-methyltransferase [uncultured Dongia sp.]